MKNILTFILMFSVLFIVVFGSHFFLYISLVRFFGISALRTKIIIGGVLVFLSVSFILASTTAHLWDNSLTRGFYFAAGSWLGALAYFFLTFLIIWIIFGVAKFFHATIPLNIFGIVAIFLSLLISGYGLWNANNPQITDVNVTLKNLPRNWKGKTIVQISDIHLGHIIRADFLARVITEINEIKPDAVMITGDLYDGMDGNLEHLIDPINKLQAPKGIYYVTGNHETYLGVARTFESLKGTKVHILKDELVDVDGLQIIGIDYPERGEQKNIPAVIKSLKTFDSNKPSILLFHTPTQVAEIAKTGVNLQLSGHTHVGQIWPFGYITELIFGPYYYGLNTIGDYNIFTSSGLGTWGPPMRVGTKAEIVVIRLK